MGSEVIYIERRVPLCSTVNGCRQPHTRAKEAVRAGCFHFLCYENCRSPCIVVRENASSARQSIGPAWYGWVLTCPQDYYHDLPSSACLVG